MPKKAILIYSNQDAAKIEEAFAKTYGYRDTTADKNGQPQPNPQTKWEFVLDKLEDFIAEITQAHEFEAARAAVVAPVKRKASSKSQN